MRSCMDVKERATRLGTRRFDHGSFAAGDMPSSPLAAVGLHGDEARRRPTTLPYHFVAYLRSVIL